MKNKSGRIVLSRCAVRGIKITGFSVFLCVLIALNASAEVELADGIKTIEPEIRAYVETRASQEDKRASPYISDLIRGDINGDGKEDVYMAYAITGIGGGNFSMLYHALFLNDGRKLVFQAERVNGSFGTAQGKSYTPLKIKKGDILCSIYEYGPDDGVCCSIKGTGLIVFKNGKLIERR